MATLDLVGLVVNDMGTSLAFYRLLGLEIPITADAEDHVELTLPGGLRLAWDTLELIKSINEEWVVPTGHRIGLAFKCENPDDVDALYAAVLAAGYEGHKAPWDAFWGQRYAQVIDPDGNLVDIFADQ